MRKIIIDKDKLQSKMLLMIDLHKYLDFGYVAIDE